MISNASTTAVGTEAFDKLSKDFATFSKSQQASILASKALSNAQKEALTNSVAATAATTGQAAATGTLAVAEGEAAAATGGLSAMMTGLSATMSKLWTTVLAPILSNPLTWAIAIGAAAVALEDFLTVDYDEAHEALDASTEKYQETQSSLESLNSELETTKSRINELQALKDAGTITLAEDAELESLQAQNDELEHQIELKQQLADVQSQEAIADAKEAAEKESHSVAQSIRAGDSKGEKDFKGTVGKVTDKEAIKEDVKLISEYKDKVSEAQDTVQSLQNKMEGKSIWDDDYFRTKWDLKNAQSELDHYTESLETAYADLNDRSSSIQSELDVLKLNPTENADLIRELESALQDVSNIDLSGTQKNLAAIQSFFDGSSDTSFLKQGIQSRMEELDKVAKNYQDEKQKIADWGLNDYADDILNQTMQTKFGNIDMDKRAIITWSDELKKTYADALSSWDYDPVVGDIDSVLGTSARFRNGNLKDGVEVAFTPIMDVDGEARLLDKNTVYDYIGELIGEATTNGQFSEEKLLDLDKQGKQIGDTFVQGILAAADEGLDYDNNGNWAETVGRLMHFSGKYGALANTYNDIERAAKKAGLSSRDFMEKLSESSNSTYALQAALDDMGISLEDIGLSGVDGLSDLQQYFSELSAAAEEANKSVQEFDGSVESISKAGESDNKDKDWNTVSDLFKKAKELDKTKKWGTDDFQSMAQFIAPNEVQRAAKNSNLKAIDYKNLWDTYSANFAKYFNADNPLQSAINAQDALLSAGLGVSDSDNVITWTKDFKSSADAARAMGISVQAAEAAMRNLESYGAEFDGISFPAEELDKFKGDLEGIKEIRDSMEDGAEKDRLSDLISKYDEQYNEFSEHIENTPADLTVDIEFQYSMAQLMQQIEEAKSAAEANDTVEAWGNVAEGYATARNKLEAKRGYQTGDDAGYEAAYTKIDNLRTARSYSTDDNLKVEYTKDIAAIEQLQTAWNQFKMDGGDLDWNDYLKSDQATSTLEDIMKSTQLTKDDLANLFGLEPNDMQFSVEAQDNASDVVNQVSQEEIQDKIVNLVGEDHASQVIGIWDALKPLPKFATLNADDQASVAVDIWNGLSADPKFTELSAEDQATVVCNLWNDMSADPKFSRLTAEDKASAVVEVYNQLNAEDKKSLITQTGGEAAIGVARTVASVIAAIPNSKLITIKAAASVSGIKATANAAASAAAAGLAAVKYTGTMLSPAHASGTAYNMLNLKPAYANGKAALDQDEDALVNELGTESIIRGNTWSLLPGGMHVESLKKGDIVLNARQTSDLLQTGKASGHARAYASGTLLASAYGSGMLGLGGKGGNYKGSSSKKSSSKSSNNSGNSSNSNSGNSDNKDFEEIKDWVEVYLKRQERITSKLVDAIDDAVGLVDKQSATNAAIAQVQAEIAANQKAINTYKNKANSVELAPNYKNQVINGTLNIETIKDEDLKDKIEDFTEWHEKMLDCEDTIDDLKDKLKDLAKQKFDNVTKEFENQIDLIKHETDMIDAYIDQIEERGYLVSTKLYDQMIAHEKDNLSKLQSEYDNLTTTLQDLLDSGLVTKYSDQWYEMMGDINDVTEAIVESNTAIIKYQNSIRDIKWDVFDKLQERISAVKDESDFLIDLMSHEKMYDSKTGDITKYGQATLGLHAVNYNTLMAQADEYGKEIAEIEKQLEVDPNNLTLVERYNDLIDKQRDAITGAKDAFKDAIDLIQDGFDSFLDAMDKAIQKRKDELSAAKDLYDYEKQIAEHTKEIGNLEKQLNAYKGDDSEEARKTIQELKNSLEDAKNNLNETEYERYISDQEQMLDNLYDDAEEWINQRLDDNEWLLNQLIKYTNDNAGSIQETINGETNSVGYRLSEAMKGIWDTDGGATKVVGKYAENFSSLLTTTNEVLEKIRGYIAKMVGESDKKAEETVKDNTPAKQPEETPKPAPAPTPPKQNTSGGDGVPRVGDAVTYTSGNYYYSSDGVSPLGNMYRGGRVYITSINNASWATKPYHISTGSTLGNGDLGWVSLSQLVGYKTGGLVDDTGVAMLHGSKQHPEMVLNAKDTEAFMDLTEILRRLASRASNGLEAIDDPFSNLDISVNPALNIPTVTQPGTGSQSTNIENHFNIDFNLPNVQNADQLITELQRNNRFEKVVQSMTLGAMTGKNSMDKYRY